MFVAEGPFYTASGGHAAADLMLEIISRVYGRDLVLSVADQMVYNSARDGSADQKVSFMARSGVRNPKFSRAVAFMRSRLEDNLGMNDLARETGISIRQLERLFDRYLDTTPKRYLTQIRMERARQLLTQTEMSVAQVCVACGFPMQAVSAGCIGIPMG